jgi:hypothetical protein
MKKFTDQDVDVHSDHEPDATYYDTREADARFAQLEEALESILDRYVSLVGSREADEEEPVETARKLLAARKL